jgi:glycerol-3-phosphate dehydrogenase (NAD(P)+)
MKIGIIGAGRWGTALSNLLSYSFEEVFLWAREKEIYEGIKKERRNPFYFPFLKLKENVIPKIDFDEIENLEYIFITIPTQFIRSVIKNLNPKKKPFIISCSKGIEINTLKRPSEIIKEVLKNKIKDVFVLSGPNFAEEIVKELPTASVLAGDKRYEKEISFLQKKISNKYFRIYISFDLKGVEIGGALKNVYAIGAGIIDGIGLGYNARASYIIRSMVEMVRFGKKMGAKPQTFAGLSGLGDLILTATGDLSRNRKFGILIANGEKIEDALNKLQTVEGYYTVKPLIEISKKYKIEMPIAEKIYEILYKGKNLKEAIYELMTRKLKKEDIL